MLRVISSKMAMFINRFLLYFLLALSHGVLASQLPSSGSEMQQIPAVLSPQKESPKIEVEQGQAPIIKQSESIKIVVKKLNVSGATAYSENDLLRVTGFNPGSEMTLLELRTMATRIAEYYHRNGYFLAQAYLPVQDIKDGVVSISVIEGQYGKILLHNKSNLSDDRANTILSGLSSGDLIASAPLESRLLLLSDLPGINVKSTLVPGASVGASDLIVDVVPGQSITGSGDTDNAGDRYTGANRVGATINLNDPTGHADVATLRALISGTGLKYARASYQMQLVKTKAGLAYSTLGYSLGQEFSGLQANGTAKIASVYGSYPLIRSRNVNLYAQIAFDTKTFQDKVDSASTVTDKKAA